MNNTRYMLHVIYIEHVQIKSLIFFFSIESVVRRFASHVSDTFNKEVKTSEAQEKTSE
jgi:hypothetical protein